MKYTAYAAENTTLEPIPVENWDEYIICKAKDPSAVEVWMTANSGLIRGWVKSFVKEGVVGFEFSDLYQEALIAVWDSFAGYDVRRVDIKIETYCHQVVVNRLISYERRATAKKRVFEKVDILSDAELENDFLAPETMASYIGDVDPSEKVSDKELLSGFYNGCSTDEERVVFAMLYSGYTQVEIANYLGYSQPTVCSKIKALRARLTERTSGTRKEAFVNG